MTTEIHSSQPEAVLAGITKRLNASGEIRFTNYMNQTSIVIESKIIIFMVDWTFFIEDLTTGDDWIEIIADPNNLDARYDALEAEYRRLLANRKPATDLVTGGRV